MTTIEITGLHTTYEPEYLNFVKKVLTILEIPFTGLKTNDTNFGTLIIEMDDCEEAFLLKLQDFGDIYVEELYGEHGYQFEMLDTHTAKQLAEKIGARLSL